MLIRPTATLPCLLAVLPLGCDDAAAPAPHATATLSAPMATRDQAPNNTLFVKLPAAHTGVSFDNRLPENATLNILRYQYFYNGGGVAVGDVNGDGRPDLYFSGNITPNKLYLNQGGMRFEDATKRAGVGGKPGWTTGVAMVDVNGDGKLDIYVSRSGRVPPEQRHNELFINHGDGTFSDQAAAYGLADSGYGTHAAFFDFDGDGDLDAYVLNHPIDPLDPAKLGSDITAIDKRRDPDAGDKLYRNDGGHFVDVSEQAQISGTPLGYGLSVSVGDLDDDGRPDLYVCNDFMGRDFLYMNRGDGTFDERLVQAMGHISQFSMGADIADFDNDGRLDVFVADMAPADNYRQKTMMKSMNVERFNNVVRAGFHYQYMFNSLQLNRGNGTFAEVGQLAGVAKTDWSWSGLLVDLDSDGFKDVFVTNGRRKDASNVDFTKKKDAFVAAAQKNPALLNERNMGELLASIPTAALKNQAFRNRGDLTFEDVGAAWGLDEPSHSNGAAYADLDGDGDLDMVVSNIDAPALIYENRGDKRALRIALKGPKDNPFGIGARVVVRVGDMEQTEELYLTRGFQSSVEPALHFGVGNAAKVDELRIRWPGGKSQVIRDVATAKPITLAYADAGPPAPQPPAPDALLSPSTALSHRHRENEHDDYAQQLLLPRKLSVLGPPLAVGDANGDGLDDVFVGGAKDHAGALYIQTSAGFEAKDGPWKEHARSEDAGALWFDADGDGDDDLYVASGGYETSGVALQDRLYLNDKGAFRNAELPNMPVASAALAAGDYDGDGDLDLFVGGRVVAARYPDAPRSYVLRNDGGRFEDVTEVAASGVAHVGMVTAALWSDVDGDGDRDLLMVGEWMPITLFRNDGGKLVDATDAAGLKESHGWWASLAAGDFDGDGDTDYVAGNLGLNSKFRASPDEPFTIYADDFDDNGRYDVVLAYAQAGTTYPVRGRQCSSEQVPSIAEKFPSYDAYGKASVADVYGEAALAKAKSAHITTLASSVIINRGGGKLGYLPLPTRAQLSPANGVVVHDFTGDGKLDVALAGNFFDFEVETPRQDAGSGMILEGDGKGGFTPLTLAQSGLFAPGDVRALALLKLGDKAALAVANNDAPLQLFVTR